MHNLIRIDRDQGKNDRSIIWSITVVNPKGDKGAMSPLQMQKKVIFMKKGELKKKKSVKKPA